MPATTWRISGLTIPEGLDLVIPGLRVFAGDTDVTALATASASFAPDTGAVSALTDGDPLTSCTWAAAKVRQPGFYIDLAFSAAQELTHLYFGTTVYTAQLSGGGTMLSQAGKYEGDFFVGVRPYWAKSAIGQGATGFWSLTGATASQVDEVAGVRNATRTGGSVVSAVLATGGTQAFDPQTTGLIRIPSASGLDAADFTICLDVQYTTTANRVIAEHGTDNLGWSIQSLDAATASAYGVTAGLLSFAFGGPVERPVLFFSGAAVNDGNPHRVIIRAFASGTAEIYVDGVRSTQRGTSSVSGPRSYNTGYIDVGSRNGAIGLPASSAIANFAIFDRALSAAEIAAVSGSTNRPLYSAAAGAQAVLKSPAPFAQGQFATNAVAAQSFDTEFGGDGVIYGTVAIKTNPTNTLVARRVRLRRSRDGLHARETWSNAQGEYRFEGINRQYEYDVEAWDHTGNMRSVLANNVTPEKMP